MADNFTPGTTAAPVATDDIDGVHYQRFKVGYGPDGSYTDATPDAGVPTVGGYTELSGSASANSTDLVASTDVRPYRWLSMQLSGTFSATVRVQGSNDNTNWTDCVLQPATGTTVLTLATGMGVAGVWHGPVATRYIRVRTTTYSSGTVTATIQLWANPGSGPAAHIGNVILSNTTNSTTYNGDGTTTHYMGGGDGDHVYNGTNWDRIRSATAADGTTGIGVQAAGAMGFDGTNYRRIKTDTSGNLTVGNAYTELTGTASSATTIVSADLAGNRFLDVHVVHGASGNVVEFEGSWDNTTWAAVPLYRAATTTPSWSTNTAGWGGGTQHWAGSLPYRYFRLRTSSYSSGTDSVTVLATPSAPGPNSVQALTGLSLSSLTIGGVNSSSDGATTNLNGLVAASFMRVFNGTSWDRARNVTAVDGSGSTGLLAAGMMALDGAASVNRRVQCDATGRLLTKASPATGSTVTSVSASVTSVTLVAANSARGRVTVFNDSTAYLYLKLGATASATSYTIKMAGGGYYETPDPQWQGTIDGIWEAANGAARITELAA